MGLFNSRSAAAASSWLLLSLALLILHVQAQRRYALHGYRGRRIGQPRLTVEAPLPHIPYPVPITLLGGGAKLMFPPPPKEFVHANFLPHSEPVDGTSGVIKIQFSRDEDDTSLAVKDLALEQEKNIANFQTTIATTTTLDNEQKSHFVVLQDFVLPLETEPPSNIPKALTSNIGQLQDVDVLSNSIPEVTTFAANEELLTVNENDIVLLTSESPKNLEINSLTLNVSDLTPKFNISVNSETHKNSEMSVITQNIADLSFMINSTVNSELPFDLTDVVKSDPINSNSLEVLPLFSETHGSDQHELLRLSSTKSEPESDHNSNNFLGGIEEADDSESLKIADPFPNITVKLIVSTQSTFEDDVLASTSENIDVPATDTLFEEFIEIHEQESLTTESSISLPNLTTIDPQPFKRSNQENKYQPIWVTHDFGRTNKALSQKSLSSVSHHTWRNPTWH